MSASTSISACSTSAWRSKQRQHVGTNRIMFATDFPHIECEWPNSRPLIDKIYADVPEADKRRIWADNCVEFFKLDRAAV